MNFMDEMYHQAEISGYESAKALQVWILFMSPADSVLRLDLNEKIMALAKEEKWPIYYDEQMQQNLIGKK